MQPFLRKDVGKWETHDFDKEVRITKTFDITTHLTAAGTYRVGFKYTTGWWGLHVFRVALAAAPADQPDKLTILSEDKHDGVAAARNKANVYAVKLDKHDPAVRYLVIADVRGVTSVGKPPERQGCNGSVWMKGVLPEDCMERLREVKPLTDEELRQRAAERSCTVATSSLACRQRVASKLLALRARPSAPSIVCVT